MMTNEQTVMQAEMEIAKLKDAYIKHLNPIAVKVSQYGEKPSLQELLLCQQLGSAYFNFIENFVGNSGLLGAHANGKWVTGFAETCHNVLKAVIVHINFLRSYSIIPKDAFTTLDEGTYANMQRMAREYLPKKQWKNLEKLFKDANLPITGFKHAGVGNMKETPKWQLVVGLIIGVFFSLMVLVLAMVIPNPTPTQFFIFRGVFSVALSAVSAIIPGFLNVESRFQQFSIRATGAIAIFIIVWFLNPPELVSQ
ncbi:hypothetical protein AXN64_21110 [Salmonella enterica subsp. enterica]|nr:hypothetical protein [Salmonella enterica subsp. enterica]ECI1498583.1 hypothetical protein [Salmonella enterica subsp. enterica serovar Kentucky]EDE2633013.1 hypothetical protein [Salmonella enterica subsp. enterica serovar Blijdorp]EDT5584225.1 hypothetical protein [Salmonella enterica subsp. enterica serovar Choleraesuis]HAF4750578.1 hypothetical protein [Salmonella enterica]